jgi:hypothetical protein
MSFPDNTELAYNDIVQSGTNNNHKKHDLVPKTGARLTKREHQASSILYAVDSIWLDLALAVAWESCDVRDLIDHLEWLERAKVRSPYATSIC